MPALIPTRGLQVLATNDASALDIRTAVFTGAVPADATVTAWNFLSDAIASTLTEATVTNYARQDLAGVTVTEVDANSNVTWTATAPTISAVGSGETWTTVVHYVHNASDSAAEILVVDTPASSLATNGGDVTLPQFSVTLSQV